MKLNYSLNELDQVAKKLITQTKSKIIVFNAEMGIGKTTLIKAIVKTLGCDNVVSSPTFSLVNEYHSKDNTIYHFDLYRIENEEELYDFGIEHYLNSDHWILVEWPNLLKPLLQEEYSSVAITLLENGDRCLELH